MSAHFQQRRQRTEHLAGSRDVLEVEFRPVSAERGQETLQFAGGVTIHERLKVCLRFGERGLELLEIVFQVFLLVSCRIVL